MHGPHEHPVPGCLLSHVALPLLLCALSNPQPPPPRTRAPPLPCRSSYCPLAAVAFEYARVLSLKAQTLKVNRDNCIVIADMAVWILKKCDSGTTCLCTLRGWPV